MSGIGASGCIIRVQVVWHAPYWVEWVNESQTIYLTMLPVRYLPLSDFGSIINSLEPLRVGQLAGLTQPTRETRRRYTLIKTHTKVSYLC